MKKNKDEKKLIISEMGDADNHQSDIEFEDDIVKELLSEYEHLRMERMSLELQWRLNMNFLQGNQFAEITPLGDIEEYGKQYYWQEREVYNHIAPIIETRLAKLGRVKASVSVRPFSNDDSDIKTAALSTGVLKAVCEDNNLSQMLITANYWSEICGSVFYKVIWDKDSGALIGKKKNNEEVHEGDVKIELCPAYEIFPDNLSNREIEDCRYIIHAKVLPAKVVADIWGIAVEGKRIETFGMQSESTGGGLGYAANYAKIGTNYCEDSVVLLEKYERPSGLYPNGRLIITAGNKLLHYGELPYNVDSNGVGLPFVKQVTLENVANFFGSTVIERIIPLQRVYNSIKNRKHEFLNRIAMGILTVEDGAIDLENIEEDGLAPGRVLVYRQGFAPPRMVEMGSVPDDFTLEEDRLRNEIMQISGVSELMRYTTLPSNVTSGIAISLLQEQDDTRISITAEEIRQAVKRIGQMILRLYKQFAANKRVKRIAGDNGAMQLHYFIGSQLASEDLVFDTDNELSDTPANRRNMVFELIKMGILHDENGRINDRNRVKILEMLGFGNWENSVDIDECHREKALRENLKASNGEEIKALDVDNHEIHIIEHTKALIQDKAEQSLIVKLLKHIKEHQTYNVVTDITIENGGE